MNRFTTAVSSGRSLRGSLSQFVVLLVSVVGAFWLSSRFAPGLPRFVPELLAATLLTVVCMVLLRRSASRGTGRSKTSDDPESEQIIEQVSEGILTINQHGRIISLNPAAQRLFGYHAREVLHEPVTKLLTEPPNENAKLFHDTMAMGTILGLAAGAREMVGQHKDGSTFPIELVMSGMTLGDEQVTVVFARDVSKRKQAQRYLTAHYAATCILAEANSLEEARPQILQSLSEALQWDACAYWSFDPTTETLCCDEIYQAPFAAPPVVLDTKSLTCKLEQGLVGRVWSTGKPQWIEGISKVEDAPCVTLAAALRLHEGFAFPIVMGQEVCGVLALFTSQKLKRDQWLLDIMREFGKQMGQFIARKRDQEMLQRSEERFRQLAENIHEVFWMVDIQDSQIIYVSPSCEEVWGQPSMKFVHEARSFLNIVHEEDQARVLASWKRQKRGENTSEEYRIVWPDGSIHWVWDRAFALRNDKGEVYRVVGINADVTHRRRMEEALRETTQTLQALIHAAPVGITIVGQEGDVQLWNPAAERMFGWSKAEVFGEQLPWSRADECGESASELSGVLQGQTHEVLPTRRLKKDGSLLDVSLSAAPLRNSEGTIFGAMSILADLTEQKRLEERLRQAQKMEAVGQLSGGIAHDFNNLLTIIIGYSEILLAQAAPGGQVHELQEQIHKAGERAAALTRQLLAFGRKQTLQVKILDINAVVQDMAKMLRRMIGEDIEMVIQPDPLLGHVKADLAQIEQILMNLASNARDAMPNGGTLTVRTANIELDESQSCLDSEIPPNSYVMLTVTDTGDGMTEATRQRVFEPFFTTKEVGKGTGLGLATVYGIVKQSNGHIEVDSEVGRGTTFRIYLPRLAGPTATSNDQPSPSGILRGKETVLLVEDEDAVRLLVTHALKSNGYNVLSASSGEEALKLCREHSEIALMVTDVIMPQMNGVQLAELATSFRENLKVLYMSGYTNNILENHGAFDSTTAFLPKPVSPRVLAKKVREVLDARPYEAAC